MVKKEINVILLSSIFLVFIIYFRIIKIPQNNLVSFIPEENICAIKGVIISNPIKSSQKYYTTTIQVQECYSKHGIISKATGKQKLLIPTKIIEAFYPNKLFSKNYSNKILLPLEQGNKIFAKVQVYSQQENNSLMIVSEVLETSFGNSFTGELMKFRALCRIHFKRLMSLWGSAGGFLLALLSGSKEYLNENLKNSFRYSGLSHILALSGMHLSMISSLAGIFENKSAFKKLGLIFRIFIILLFVWFAGLSPSLLRALISCLLVSACTFFNIPKIDGLVVLGSTFLIHSVIQPTDLFNLGFLFSYSALLGILIFSKSCKALISRYLPPLFSNNISSSISANLFTAPISIKAFGMYSPIGIICTVFVSPLITIFLYCGILFLAICILVPQFAVVGGYFMNYIYILIYKIVDFFNLIPPIFFN